MNPIHVSIFDDNPSIRHAISLLLQTKAGLKLVSSHEDVSEVIRNITEYEPDVVLMDIDMPKRDGIDGLRAIRRVFPQLPVIMLTVFDDEEKIFAALRAGANGYLLKETAPLLLIQAIEDVYQGGAPMTPSIAKKVLSYFHSPVLQKQNAQYRLTKREQEVLSCLVNGLSYKETGVQLFISFETVRSHIRKIYEKLHVSSLTEAVAKAIREGLVE
ncbi:MAG: response regulator transcription factor [Bacteroidota bacterium]